MRRPCRRCARASDRRLGRVHGGRGRPAPRGGRRAGDDERRRRLRTLPEVRALALPRRLAAAARLNLQARIRIAAFAVLLVVFGAWAALGALWSEWPAFGL